MTGWNLQIKIINEERLDLSEESAQIRLYQQMLAYLNFKIGGVAYQRNFWQH